MKALVLGSADCLLADIDAALALFVPDMVVACNDAGVAWPGRLDHWATLHPKDLPTWIGRRAAKGLPPARCLWTHAKGKVPEGIVCRRIERHDGSSGLLAVRAARAVGATRLVLCGIPLSGGEHIAGLSRDRGNGRLSEHSLREYRAAWKTEPDLKRIARSMSGWTAEFLGMPDRTWIEDSEA